MKSLEQRQRTILKVASEIVRLQDGFFEKGVEHLRPLNLRAVADAISMHKSTVSRVTSNKYMMTPRGLFELKYFFSASIAAASGAEAHSAEAVRFKIKQMIDKESPSDVLSDDAIVARLKELDIDIARRTVAKYRDSLRIPSSVDRRRQKLGESGSASKREGDGRLPGAPHEWAFCSLPAQNGEMGPLRTLFARPLTSRTRPFNASRRSAGSATVRL